jgi:hypothetical protein
LSEVPETLSKIPPPMPAVEPPVILIPLMVSEFPDDPPTSTTRSPAGATIFVPPVPAPVLPIVTEPRTSRSFTPLLGVSSEPLRFNV